MKLFWRSSVPHNIVHHPRYIDMSYTMDILSTSLVPPLTNSYLAIVNKILLNRLVIAPLCYNFYAEFPLCKHRQTTKCKDLSQKHL